MRRLALMTAGFLAAGGLAVGLGTAGPAHAASGTFTNSAPLAVPDNSSISSDVQVSGIGGRITDVDVVLTGLGHAHPSDLDIWIRGPGSNAVAVPLMSDACGGTPVAGRTLTFDDAAAAAVPSGCASGSYRPTNISGGDTTPSGATTLGSTLAAFNGTSPVGNWRLFVVDDATNDVGSITGGFTLKITTSSAAIAIPTTSGTATPYPYQRTISDQAGKIVDVDVVLNGVFHSFPDDIDLLLVSPSGASVILMSDSCSSDDLVNVNLRFDDSAAAPLPPSAACTSGTYKPSNPDAGDAFNAPAPAGPYGDELSDLIGGPGNGTWRVFVLDDDSSDGGFITSVSLVVKTDATPNTVITKKPQRTTKARKAVIGFKSTKGGSTFQCKVDKKAWKACSSPLRLKKLKPGKHTVRVRARDNAGHVDATPAKVTWKIRR